MADIDIAGLINAALGILGLVGVPTLVVLFAKSKSKLKQLRTFIDDIDDAATDNNVSEAEFQKILADGKALIS